MRNMDSIKLKFKSSAKDGKAGTLIYQVVHKRETRRIRSRYHICNDEWDGDKGTILVPAPDSPRYENIVQISKYVEWELKRLNDIAKGLAVRNVQLTSGDIVKEFMRFINNTDSVFTYLYKQVEHLSELGRKRSSEMLQSALNRLIGFRCGLDFSFYIFNSDMMERFEAYMKQQQLKRNTIGFYMRTLRTQYNLAVEDGLTENKNPFRKVYTGKDKTVKRPLSFSELKNIKALDLSSVPHLDFARDMLLFSFYARGMSFVDMAYLRKCDKKGSYFYYSRRKTGQALIVEWVSQMQDILNKYTENETSYLLPIITKMEKDERLQYKNKNCNIARNLKIVGKMANVSGSLTLYRARHAWATLAREKNVPVAVISEALGHDSEKTTEIYLAEIRTTVVDKVNHLLIKEL